jgi:hypothetical protein
MSTLTLRIDKYVDSVSGTAPSVFATIYAINPKSGRKDQTFTARRELVPISNRPADTRSVELAAGHYVVEVSLPSGELLTDQVEVKANAKADLVLAAEDSPREWLSWQHLVGNVATQVPPKQGMSRAAPPAHPSTAAAPPGGKTSAARGEATVANKTLSRGPRASARRAGARSSVAAAPPPRAVFAPPAAVNWLPTPMPGLAPAPAADPWAALAAIADNGVGLAEQMNSGNPTRGIPLYLGDEKRAIYRVVHGGTAVDGATPLRSPLRRDFIAVPQGESVELIVLPTPWVSVSNGQEAVVEIVVQQGVSIRDFATSVSVRDDRLGVLLGYLTSGALGAVREIATTAKDMLYGKTMNELAAAAGAYAMVGTATDSKVHEWHSWVDNLANWFPHVPDGHIQRARLRLQLRRGPADIDEARKSLKEAYRRGLPYYSLGVRWLLEGLERIAGDDPEAEAMLRQVRALSWRLHPQSAFTILQLGRT